jgi:molecular chaperone DnaK (HSP70)
MMQKPDKGGKKKVKVRWVDLPVTPYVPQMTKDKIQLLFEKEVQMIAQDRQEKERADSKNAVEEYVLEMRKHLSDKYEPFVREEDREKFMALLTSTEDWLYDEGEDTQKSIYVEKLVQMRVRN